MNAAARSVLVVLALAATSAFAANGAAVYKWKDASGALHFTDSPPPAGATLLQGPPPPPAPPVVEMTCNASLTAEQCAAARKAFAKDAQGIVDDTPPPDPAAVARAKALEREKAEAAQRSECTQQRHTLDALEQRRSGGSTETLGADEQAALPKSIADTEAWLAAHCAGH